MRRRDSRKLGFIGLGFVGESLADNFRMRGYVNQVRYSLDRKYARNRKRLAGCETVFIAVPTPTVEGKADLSALVGSLGLVSPSAVAVVKSTVPPGELRRLKESGKVGCRVILCPEFLDASTARHDTDNPLRNVVGVEDMDSADDVEAAERILRILPKAPLELVCSWDTASFVKYGGNCFFFMKNTFFNVLHDVMETFPECDSETVRRMVASDCRIGDVHTRPVDKGGRGAGGACLPKDFRVFRELAACALGQFDAGNSVLFHAERRNRKLLRDSSKDQEMTEGIYGR
jgi:UDPglucose 6-dehydrogenase